MIEGEPDNVVNRGQFRPQLIAQLPQPTRQLVRFSGREVHVVVRGDQARYAGVVDVGERESHGNGRGQNSRLTLHLEYAVHQAVHGFAKRALHGWQRDHR